jgi:hypothetical protein
MTAHLFNSTRSEYGAENTPPHSDHIFERNKGDEWDPLGNKNLPERSPPHEAFLD